MNAPTQNNYKVSVKLSKNEDYIILNDEKKQKIIVNVNLVKHCLGIPFMKKDGNMKTAEEIESDKLNAKIAYVEAASRHEEMEPIL
jgi:hypothetical protein